MPAPIVDGTMTPWCMMNNCNSWGWGKVVDSKAKSLASLGIVGHNTSIGARINGFIQLDMGQPRADIAYVRLVAPIYQTAAVLPDNMSVYLSSSTDFRAGTLCAASIAFDTWGEESMVECPANVTAKYVTVIDNVHTRRLALAEITPLYDGGYRMAAHAHESI